MRNASPQLIALLNNVRQYYAADLLTIVQANGAITRLTSADRDLTVVSQYDNASHTFSSAGPIFTRGTTKLVLGLEIDALSLTFSPDPAVHRLGGLAWPAAAAAGMLDEARVLLERVIMGTFGDTSAGTLIQFAGRVGQTTPTRAGLDVEVRSDLELLTTVMPRNSFQPGCVHTLFDSGCTLLKSAFTSTSTAALGSTASSILSVLPQGSGFFELGAITFTAGVNAGLTRSVQSYTAGAPATIALVRPFPSAPAIGDAFSIVAGCDKTKTTCTNRFANLAHFRGYPFVPVPEQAR